MLLLNSDKTINEWVLLVVPSLFDNNQSLLLNSLDDVIVVPTPDKAQDYWDGFGEVLDIGKENLN